MGKINIKKILKVWFNVDKEERKENISSISSLAPKVLSVKEEIDKIQPYLDKLKDTIETKGVNNIALTGGYGSGKSTIINTFKSLNSQYEYLNISLASFNKKKEDKNNKLTSEQKKLQRDELERLLEVSILQQIFYHVKPSEIPESRFKRIINIPDWKIWSISFGFILWFSSSILLIKYNYLDKINPINWNTKANFDFFAILIFIIAFSGLGLFSKLMIKLFSNSQINKVNFKGELELGNNVNKSVFNEHLEEILYFFERTDFNVVIIEDLDRFDSTDIFTKLREINILLNNSKLISQEINFIYAVGDALFIDKKERVKFFEYIIPVIPFINSSNAEEQLMNLVKDSELEDNVFSKEFLSDITTFIDDIDMRLLINIFHEFAIYRNILKPDLIKGSESELFAMITYKNLDPRDYDALNSNKGKLFELINNKKKYIEDYANEIDLEIQNKILEINKIESESINDFKELKSIYSNKVFSKIPQEAVIQNINFKELDDEEFNKIINDNVEYVIYSNYNGQFYTRSTIQNLKYSFVEIEKEINPNYTFKERTELIKSKHNNKINLLKNELEKLRKKKVEVENWDLKQIFKEVNINKYLKDFINSGLVRNLLIEGYINENYSDYISLFHEVSITKEDYTFERSVKGGYSSDFNYKLSDKVENLVEKIDKRYFEREAILNFDLLNYLGNNYNRFPYKYDSIIRLLSNEKEKSIQFIDKYISVDDRPLKIFIEKLVKYWKGFWDYIYLKSIYTKEKEDYYLKLIVQYALIEDILTSQNINTLATAIMLKPNFLSLVKNTAKVNYNTKIKKLIEELNIKFEQLENPYEETREIFDFIFNNNYYRINKDNVQQMITIYGSGETMNDFETANYTAILESDCKPLIEYIDSEINTYVEDMYLKLDENISENEVALINLLNNEALGNKLKIKIIQKVKTKISELKSINDLDIKTQLLINNKVDSNWNNVIHYYEVSENTLNESLVEFLEIEDVNAQLSILKLSKEDKDFERNILTCNDISDETYEKLINSIYYVYPLLEIEKLNEKKVALLTRKILTASQANYDLLRKKYPNNHITLIEKDFNKFIENIDDFETNEDDTFMILKSDTISIDNRLKYISKLNEQSISINNKISKKVGEIILTKSSKIKFEYSTLESLVTNCNLIENKVKLVNLYFDDLNDSEIISLVKSIGHYYSELFVKQHKPLFNNTIFNKELLTKLLSKELINSFDLDKKDRSKIRAVANY